MSSSFVYFIRPLGMLGPVKIGLAECPRRRLDGLAAWSPFPLEVIATVNGSFALEQAIHSVMHASHSHKEWFHPTPEILEMVKALEAGRPIEEAVNFSRPHGAIHPSRRNTRTPLSRLHMSLTMRLLRALKGTGDRSLFAPRRADSLLAGMRHGHQLTADERLYLEDVIENPSAHAFSREAKYPTARSPAPAEAAS